MVYLFGAGLGDAENVKTENARTENLAPNCTGGKREKMCQSLMQKQNLA